MLVGRRYYLGGLRQDNEGLFYGTGQPMGALSSWAMLALTHHLIVQYCASAVRPGLAGWFQSYVILGDDIVIWDSRVAAKYLATMKELGVEINLSKSLRSRIGVAEFAKRFVSFDADLSGVSLKEFQSLGRGVGALMSIVERLHPSFENFLRLVGHGSRSVGHARAAATRSLHGFV